jgi:NAD(P)-dependent dehydrogenase (short-subunit alcohol dehydrogenase family)
MGSIGAMANSGSALYRASKAGLNAIVKAAALELAPRGVIAIALHPGWVKTDMGGAGADIDAPASVAGMRAVLGRAGARESGRFFDYTGKELPW